MCAPQDDILIVILSAAKDLSFPALPDKNLLIFLPFSCRIISLYIQNRVSKEEIVL